jgi:thiosulfate/3-mercaptopyruvate sulfurtransferase
MPNDPHGRTGFSVFQTERIPTARLFDLDEIKDHDSPYPHMLPTAETFAKAMGELGIRRDDDIVVYDTSDLGVFSAPRVCWTLRVFGHDKVFLLNNFKLWVEQGFPIETGDVRKVEVTDYPVPELDRSKVVSFEEVRDIAKDFGSESAQILDARPYGRWTGKDPEPRKGELERFPVVCFHWLIQGLSSGHIPGSISLPFPELLDPATKALLPKQELLKIFESKGVDQSIPIICTCGTGVTAAVIDAALDEAEFGDPGKRRLYDGSWT